VATAFLSDSDRLYGLLKWREIFLACLGKNVERKILPDSALTITELCSAKAVPGYLWHMQESKCWKAKFWVKVRSVRISR
jgi:hypothetical protein